MAQTDNRPLLPSVLSHADDFIVDHAEGSWVYGKDGSKWLDFVMGIAVVNTGHCHPKVVAAAREQAGKIIHAQQNMYYHQPMLDLSAKLLEISPSNMDQVFYVNSGAEAVENAVKISKITLRRPGVIAFHNAFHGRTHLTMALTDSVAHYRGRMEPLVGSIYHARFCDPFHTPASEDPLDYALSDLQRVLRAEIYGDDVACIIAEPIQGEGGFIVPPAEFFRELRKVADEIGAYLVLDEIQAGIGRTGKWFGHQHYGMEADMMTVAKGIASGFPLSAVVGRKEIFDKVNPGSIGGTYGGNVGSCAAGVASLDAIREDGMLENATRQGEKLRKFFVDKQAQYPCIGDVRGIGLMDAIETVVPGTRKPDAAPAKAFIAECNKHKVILLGAGSFGNCVRFLPALNISDADLDHAFSVFDEAAKVAFA